MDRPSDRMGSYASYSAVAQHSIAQYSSVLQVLQVLQVQVLIQVLQLPGPGSANARGRRGRLELPRRLLDPRPASTSTTNTTSTTQGPPRKVHHAPSEQQLARLSKPGTNSEIVGPPIG